MRKIFTFLLLFAPIACIAHTLHVGEMSIPLHTTKWTTPSVNFLIDGDVWYLPMVKVAQQNTMHLLYKNDVYTVCRGIARKVGSHYFVGDCLVGVDDNVYLESTGEQYIDTGVNVGNSNTIRNEYNISVKSFNGGWTGANAYTQLRADGYCNGLSIQQYDKVQASYPACINIDINKKYRVVVGFNAVDKRETLSVNSEEVSVSWGGYDRHWNVGVFALANVNIKKMIAKIYSFVLDVDGVTLGQFIPVPSGMQIGDYVVPSNGMWNIVEQKFYGNSGTGDFIYGVDE